MADKKSTPALSRGEFARWTWRQLTSMRTALFLLLFLAIAAIPGSFIPQRGVDAALVERYFLAHPKSAPILDDLGFFSVYTSPWFSAIYLLLMVSLIGCIIPRLGVYLRAVRARPPKAPANFSRLPASAQFETEATVDEVLAAGRTLLPRSRIDVVDGELRAEKGYLREFGNLVFHTSIVFVLVGVAFGQLYGYRGSVIVSEGEGFSNTLASYDEFGSGSLFNEDDLPPFALDLTNLTAQFQLSGPQRGAPRKFEAAGTYTKEVGDTPTPFAITVNHPLKIDGTNVFLVGQGYAPVIKVTDAKGNVVLDGPVPFLPVDATYTSNGVIKAPEAQPDQLGFQGFFLPTAVAVGEGAPISAFPAAANPLLGLFAYYGDLGMDDGIPQSVYVLDKSKMTQFLNKDGTDLRIDLSPGQEQQLPDGSTIQYVKTAQFAKFQLSSTPLLTLPLWAISIGVLGLIMSLYIRPRRTWIRATRQGSRTVVDVAALNRITRDDLGADLEGLAERLEEALKDKGAPV
ncbi:cytochrome c biogenesis protein ResB [soil metagenome]